MQTLRVKGMRGEPCVRRITEAIRGVEPMANVEVDLGEGGEGTVAVYGVGDLEPVVQAIRSTGYEVEGMA
ncbi:MAG: heavy-metal-associated domain-containing protein [Geminicoccaceae bacterium]|nr:heavy-metal-associated domain-containing protein [Geminicoccaceae bacterium]